MKSALTKQKALEVFNKVKGHLLTQNKRSTSPMNDRYCAYRGKDGRKCAIGIFIPDDKYTEQFENIGLNLNIEFDTESRKGELIRVLGAEIGFEETDKCFIRYLASLQRLHDEINVGRWEYELENMKDKLNSIQTDEDLQLNFNEI